jgi:carboxymethylenebutenolidase
VGQTIQWRTLPEREPRAFGRMIEFGRRADSGTAYMAHSERVGPGVVVLHDFFGLTDATRAYAHALNDAGFTALAPDLFDGRVAATVEDALALARSLDKAAALKRLEGAARYLTDNWHPRAGAVGFSLGASFAGELAGRKLTEATVAYYGIPSAEAGWSGPLLGHFSPSDEWEPTDEVEAALDAIRATGAEVEAYFYDGTGHWFANECVANYYDESAAATALKRTVDFFHHHLA